MREREREGGREKREERRGREGVMERDIYTINHILPMLPSSIPVPVSAGYTHSPGYSDLDVDKMISVAIAVESGDSPPSQPDSVV